MANPNHIVTYCDQVSTTQTQTHLGGSDIYTNIANGIDLIGFFHSSRHDLWKTNNDGVHSYEYVDDNDHNNNSSSLRACMLSCEDHLRPTTTQALSLSLSSSHPSSSLALHSFQLQSRYMTSSTSIKIPTFNATTTQDENFIGKTTSSMSSGGMQFEMIRSSKYLLPSQELLNEFVNLGTKQRSFDGDVNEKNKKEKLKSKVVNDHNDDVLLVANDVDHHHNDLTNGSSSSSRINVVGNNNNNNNSNNLMLLLSSSQSLYGLNLLELQKRKTKLLAMLEELDRRYKHYNEQMKGVVSCFEAIAGQGSGNVYSSLASKVMSRHFRCLRDAIVAQIKGTKKAIGDKDVANLVPGTTKGETPRLRMLDQAFRHQKALQQMTMIENHPWRPQRGLPERSVSLLRAWLFEHFLHPYPSDVDKHILARQTGLSRSQVSNWFINARVRLWKPMVEQMYQEEAKDDHDHQHYDDDDNNNNNNSNNENQDQSDFSHDHQHSEPCLTTSQQLLLLDQKPTPNQLLMRIEPESLSSIVNTPTTTTIQHHNNNNNLYDESQHYGRNNIECFGSIESLDFPTSSSSYGAHQSHVSLTLGLQQHGGNGVNLASSSFSTTSQGSLFYGRDHIEDEQVVHHQYSLMDADPTAQNSPYRNLMGAQLLHDFAS